MGTLSKYTWDTLWEELKKRMDQSPNQEAVDEISGYLSEKGYLDEIEFDDMSDAEFLRIIGERYAGDSGFLERVLTEIRCDTIRDERFEELFEHLRTNYRIDELNQKFGTSF